MTIKKPNWYILFSIAALIIVSILYFRFHIDKQYIGIVESRTHQIGAQEPGKIRNILVEVGDSVKKGQTLATLDISDLETQISRLENELSSIEALKSAHEDRYYLEYQRLATNLADRLSLLEAKRTELSGLNDEIARLKQAENAGLGHSRDLADLILQRDVLRRYLEIQSSELQSKTQELDSSRKNRYIIKRAENDRIVQSMLSDIMERTEDLQRELSLTQYRVNLRTLVSPCDGFVVDQFAYTGDVVAEFIPVLSISESRSEFVTVYLPEKTNIPLEKGMKVRIYSPRSKKTTVGEIDFIDPGLSMTSERLSFRGQLFWARKVRVRLSENHGLLSGEVVYARINHFGHRFQMTETASAQETRSIENDGIQTIQVPASLQKKTRFEPSGIAWIPALHRCLVVSDDTGLDETTSEHAPWVFLMSDDGRVAAEPVRLQGVNEVNDLEAVAPADGGLFYLVSSQNISKKGKRPRNREYILQVKREGGAFTVQSKIHLLSLLLDFYGTEDLARLGLTRSASDGKPLLNIEGAAWHDGSLYLGLKEPVTAGGALIWKLDNLQALLNGQRLAPGQLTLWGRVNLGRMQERFAGFSDLEFDDNGNIWALSTFAQIENDRQSGGLHKIQRLNDGRLEAETLLRFDGKKPEGLTFISDRRILIVFDLDSQTPSLTYFDVE